ncbi:MAG: CPBP family intramembrane glutamic endopeptidase [Bacteroidota bacterium]
MELSTRKKNTRELVYFFSLTFCISWIVALLIIKQIIPELPYFVGIVYGPLLAAFILTAIFGKKEGLRSFFKRYYQFKGNVKWIFIILFGFFAIMYSGKFIWNLFAESPWSMNLMPLNAFLPVLLFQILIPGLGEEPGWRGYALPRLLELTTPIKASIFMALVHWLWHLPTFWLGTGIHNVPAILSILYVLPVTILFTYVYLKTKGSIGISILFHSLHGALLSLVGFMPSELDVPISTDLLTTLWIGGGYLGPYIVALVLIWGLTLFTVMKMRR